MDSRVTGLQATLVEGLRGRRLIEFQSARRSELVDLARRHAAFYRHYPPGVTALREWEDLPLVSRRDLQQSLARMTVSALPHDAGRVIEGFTSGSSGQPLRYLKTGMFDVMNRISALRFHKWWKIDPNLSLLTLRMPRNAVERSRGTFHRQALKGCQGFEYSVFDLDIGQALEHMVSLKPGYLRSYPNIVNSLLLLSQRSGVRTDLQLILTMGETVPDELRLETHRVWGCRIADAYGAEETGYIAIQCPICGLYHSCGENQYLEVLDTEGRSVTPGGIGRVVVTPLFNMALPLIRYETGDHAEVAEPPVACQGQGLTLRRVMGRARSMFIRKDGQHYWPVMSVRGLAEMGVCRFRLIQTGRDRMRFEYALFDQASQGSELNNMLRAAVQAATEDSVGVDLVPVREFPVVGAGKFLSYENQIAAHAPGPIATG
jgi:phenylacetate-CoA ligase